MEVKINREIRNYTESMFFGLSMRQFVFSLLAVVVAVGLYFLLKPYVGTETVSWMCVLGAAPFAAMGFITYHGMTAEKFIWAWIRSEFLEPKEIRFESQFIMSLVEQIDKTGVGPQQKSIIDRCTALVYQEAEANGTTATLCNLRNKLLEQPEEKAKEIALSLELFTTGSLDIFGHESTVDLDNRIVVFDIHSLGAQLKPTGLLVITDTILNRVTLNWKKGKRTHIFIDEFHVVFENEQSGIFFNSAWRQFRKRNGYPTAITQNVEYLLDSVQASTMLSNSEFVVMLNQAYSDRAKLSKLLNISDEQMSYVTNADAGCGLIKYGSALVPFINRFPRDTKLYQLMTTKPGEGVFGGNTSN